jgi:hypothetical protein
MRQPLDRIRRAYLAPSLLALSLIEAAFAGCSSESPSATGVSGGDGGADSPTVLSAHPLDTAILFPLPETAAADSLLRADASGAMGQLLPSYAVDALPALTAGKNSELVPLVRVVSANIDPCFPSGVEGKVDDKGGSLCRKQIRLIFEPVRDDGNGKLTTDDVTVHAFYEMDAATFKRMATDIINARGTTPLGDGAIDVHPIMKTQGPSGAFATSIQDIFLRYAGASNLVKVTFLALRGGGIGWQMGGVDFVGTKTTDMTVPETSVTREELSNPDTTGNFNSTVDPPTRFSKGLGVLLRSEDAKKSSDDEIKTAFKQALQIDNPNSELNPGTVDCASCHLATPTRLWVERNRGLKAADFAESYANPRWNLENRSETKENTQSFRCFGYYGRAVSISQRTINEAAAVADFINDKILGGAK